MRQTPLECDVVNVTSGSVDVNRGHGTVRERVAVLVNEPHISVHSAQLRGCVGSDQFGYNVVLHRHPTAEATAARVSAERCPGADLQRSGSKSGTAGQNMLGSVGLPFKLIRALSFTDYLRRTSTRSGAMVGISERIV